MRIAMLAYLRPIERITVGLLAFAILMVAVPIAFAQTASGADVTGAADYAFSFVQGVVVPVLLTITTGILGLVAAYLKKKLGLDADVAMAELNKTLHAGVERGVTAMEAQLRDRLYDRDGRVIVSTQKAGVDFVIERTSSMFPETLERLGVSPLTLRRLATEAVIARLNSIQAPAAKIDALPAGVV